MSRNHPRILEALEPRIAPAADLTVDIFHFSVDGVENPSVVVPGDSGRLAFTIKNIGDDKAASNVTGIHIYFSNDSVLSESELVGKIRNVDLGFDSEGQRTFRGKISIPELMISNPQFEEGTYSIFVEADSGFNVPDSNRSNNVASTNSFSHAFQFGTFADREGVKLSGRLETGGRTSFAITGNGAGDLDVSAGVVDLDITGVDSESRISARTSGSTALDIRDLNVDGETRSADFRGVNLMGDAVFAGASPSISFASVGYPQSFTAETQQAIVIGGSGQPMAAVNLDLGRVKDLDLTSAVGISRLVVDDWQDQISGDEDLITAPFISNLQTQGNKRAGLEGDFNASLLLEGLDKDKLALGKAKVKGEIEGSTWQLGDLVMGDPEGHAGRIEARSTTDWSLLAEGNVELIKTRGDLDGPSTFNDITAKVISELNVGGVLSADVTVTGATDDTVAIGKFKAGSVDGIDISATKGSLPRIDVGSWVNGGSIDALWIERLNSKGDFSADLNLTAVISPDLTGTVQSISKAVIKGMVTEGAWDVESGIGTLSIGGAESAWSLNGAADGVLLPGTHIEKIRSTGTLGGTLVAAHYGTISVKGDLTASIQALSSPDPDIHPGVFYSLDTLRAHDAVAAEVSLPQDGRFNLIRVHSWTDAEIDAGAGQSIESFGDFSGSISLTDNSPTTAFRVLSSLLVLGKADHLDVAAPDNKEIGKLVSREWVAGSIDAGRVGIISTLGKKGFQGDFSADVLTHLQSDDSSFVTVRGLVFANNMTFANGLTEVRVGAMATSTLQAGADAEIGLFRIQGIKGFTGPLFDNANVLANTINEVNVRSVNEGPSAGAFGFTASSIEKYQRFGDSKKPIITAEDLNSNQTFDEVGQYAVNITG